MISALLLPLLFSDVPARTAGTPLGDPPIQVWISNDRRFLPGDRAKVQVRLPHSAARRPGRATPSAVPGGSG